MLLPNIDDNNNVQTFADISGKTNRTLMFSDLLLVVYLCCFCGIFAIFMNTDQRVFLLSRTNRSSIQNFAVFFYFYLFK